MSNIINKKDKSYSPFYLNKSNKLITNSILLLDTGDAFYGTSFGSSKDGIGELCFNTSMTGYQEIITDPSYSKQIITFTFPHIGNVGTNQNDYEGKSSVSGIVTRQLPTNSSNWRSKKNFDEWLMDMSIPAIAGVDTRELTKIIRKKDSTNALITKFEPGKTDINNLLYKLKKYPSMNGLELCSKVSCNYEYIWKENLHRLLQLNNQDKRQSRLKIVSLDYGVKSNILRNFVSRDFEVVVLPYNTDYNTLMSKNPDGILLSNGPGDPAATDKYVFKLLNKLIQIKIPIFGICIGHQLLALTLGAKTIKMKQGHRGGNHPVKNLKTNEVQITSQNHGFVVEEKSLPKDFIITHRSLFDKSIEGFEHNTLPIFSVQFHPEASPGPTDTTYLFDKFYRLCLMYNNAKKK